MKTKTLLDDNKARQYTCSECGSGFPQLNQISGAHLIRDERGAETTCFGSARFKPGLYKLTADVNAPHPDGRATFRSEWRKQKVWKAGTEFLVRRAFGEENSIGPRDEGHRDLHAATPGRNDDEYKVLLAAQADGILVPFVELTIASVLDRLDLRASEVLGELLEKNVITYTQIAEAGAAVRGREDAERKANMEQHEREWQAKQAAEKAAAEGRA